MMKRYSIIFALPLLSAPAFAGPDVNAAANDACQCLEEPYRQMTNTIEIIKQAQVSGDMSQLTSSQEEMMAAANAATPCFEALSKKYPEIDKSDVLKDKVMAIAEKQCPRPIPPASMCVK